MSIDKLPVHYSMQNLPTIYDEEALTALELAARTTGKLNEVVEAQNTLERQTGERLDGQDAKIDMRLDQQDDKLDTFQNDTIPNTVAGEFREQLANGTFDPYVNEHFGNLEERVDNLLNNVPAGGTTMDAEVVDGRTRYDGRTAANIGGTIRTVDKELQELKEATSGETIMHGVMEDCVFWTNGRPLSEHTNIMEHTITDGVLNVTIPVVGATQNPGIATKLFDLKDPNGKVYVTIDFECDRPSVTQLYIAGQYGIVSGMQHSYPTFIPYGKNTFVFDPADYPFEIKSVWIIHGGGFATENTYHYTFREFTVTQNAIRDSGLDGNNASELISNLYHKEQEDNANMNQRVDSLTGDKHLYDFSLGGLREIWTNAVWGRPYDTANGCTFSNRENNGTDYGFVAPITPGNDKQVHIEFDLETDSEVVNFAVYAAETYDTSHGEFAQLKGLKGSGHYKVTFDPAYLAVYKNLDAKCIWILAHDPDLSGYEVTISNLKVYQSLLADNGYSQNMARAIVEAGQKNSGNSAPVHNLMVTPAGERFVLQLDNAGTLTTAPVIPGKALFIGNSLTLGFGTFGMAASDSKHDFYYLFNQVIKEKKPSYTANRVHGYGWESAATLDDEATWMADTLTPYLDSTVELVIVQLGDNVRMDEKGDIFAPGVVNLLRFIREHAPKARVAWMGAWYQSQDRMDGMVAGCAATGCTFIDIWDLNRVENQSSMGATYTDDNGTVHTIESEGVASHPGDNGFKAIANRMLYTLGIVDTETYYS